MEVSLEDLLKRAANLYEAVVVMSKRARQVNDEQKLRIMMDLGGTSVAETKEGEDFGDIEIDREALMREHEKYPKPTRVTLEEMVNGMLEYRYDFPEEKEDDRVN